MARYKGRWGSNLLETYLPGHVVKDGVITLETPSLVLLAVLLHSQYGQAAAKDRYARGLEVEFATARIGRDKLIERSGYSVNVVTAAIQELVKGKWIEQSLGSSDEQTRRKGGKFRCAEYLFLDPVTGMLFTADGRSNVLFKNHLPYFTFPRVMIERVEQPWSFAKMKSSLKRVYFALTYIANQAKSNEFEYSIPAIRKLTRMYTRTVTKALDGLCDRGLIWNERNSGGILTVKLCDPFTGMPLVPPDEDEEENAFNYKTVTKGVSKRASVNASPEAIEKLIRTSLKPGEPVTVQGNGDLMIRCPFHPDSNPSCSVSPKQCGRWQCFGCKERGNLNKLIMRLTGCTRVESMQRIGSAAGHDVYYQRPDSEAVAIYSYRDRYGNLLKQVLRYPKDHNGNKVFKQRRPASGGWKWDVQGLPPMLYNLDLLYVRVPDTVVIVEGEKDADTVTNAGLRGRYCTVIGVTSGGANTWNPALAKELRGRRVIVMGDDDETGRGYAEAVKASLEAEGIEFREVHFAGTGAKDVSDYMVDRAIDDLVELIGRDWVSMPDDQSVMDERETAILYDPSNPEEIVP